MAAKDNETKSKVRLKYLAGDPAELEKGKDILEGWYYTGPEAMLNGPICRRVAVIDIDPETGAVNRGARFMPPAKRRKLGQYQIVDSANRDAADLQQVSVFGAVMKTMAMFEEEDVLGRQLRWAFEGDQLLIVPRAGEWDNAFYHRDSRSLQFFFFDRQVNRKKKRYYTCLSPDIVVHETTHAILDGIAPDLYDASSPQALALHETIADLGAAIFAIRSRRLGLKVLELTRGNLSKSTAFNQIALEFGSVRIGEMRPLRDLHNDYSFSDWGTLPASNNPHDLCNVLSGALYPLLIKDHEVQKREIACGAEEADMHKAVAVGERNMEEQLFSASGLALFKAGQKFKRIIFRCLDYLPPGEISFADYGRALIAADISINPDDHEARECIFEEFVKRGIVDDAKELTPAMPAFKLPADLDLDLLSCSDWSAYQFAEAHRNELMIPDGIPFEVRPRLDVEKATYRSTGKERVRELLFKVAWRESRVTTKLDDYCREISITYGTTLVIEWGTKSIKALLSTSPQHASQQQAATRVNNEMREQYLSDCFKKGLLEIGSPNVQIQNQTLRLRATGEMLHMVRG